jgi:peptide/nickel transport system permease protein
MRRIATALPTLIGILLLVFLLLELAPGTAVDAMLGDQQVTDSVRQRMEELAGEDRSAIDRFTGWMGNLFRHGDLGNSISQGIPVTRAITRALPSTLALSSAALLVMMLGGLTLGALSANRGGPGKGSLWRWLSTLSFAVPGFWLGLMLILIFSVHLNWFPAGGNTSVRLEQAGWWVRLLDRLHHLVLPAIVLGLSSAGALGRFLERGLLHTFEQPFMRAARARGNRGLPLLIRHALRAAGRPIVVLLGLSLPVLVSGSLVVEVVFSRPGMGRLAFDGVRMRDFPLVLGCTLFAALAVVLGNLLSDLALYVIDPRTRTGTDDS